MFLGVSTLGYYKNINILLPVHIKHYCTSVDAKQLVERT